MGLQDKGVLRFLFMKKYLQIQNKSLEDFGVENYKSLWQKAQEDGYEGLALSVKTEITKANNNLFHAVFSTDSEDRHGDVVKQEPDLRAFKKNPVYLDSHNYDSIVHIIGKIHGISAKTGQLEGDVEFFLDNPKGMLAMKAAEQGFLNTSSIGFIPRGFDEKTGFITEWELLEISAVSVPANPEALFEKEVKEENVVIKEVTEETKEVKTTHKELIHRAVQSLADKKEKELKMIARAIQELARDNQKMQKRKLHQAIRSLLKGQIPAK